MLTDPFPKYHRRYAESLVADWLAGFADWLVPAGYARDPAHDHVRRLKQVLERRESVSANAKFSVVELTTMFTSAHGQKAGNAPDPGWCSHPIPIDSLSRQNRSPHPPDHGTVARHSKCLRRYRSPIPRIRRPWSGVGRQKQIPVGLSPPGWRSGFPSANAEG